MTCSQSSLTTPRSKKAITKVVAPSNMKPATLTMPAQTPSRVRPELTVKTQIITEKTDAQSMPITHDCMNCFTLGLSECTSTFKALCPSMTRRSKAIGYTVAMRIAPCSLIMPTSVAAVA